MRADLLRTVALLAVVALVPACGDSETTIVHNMQAAPTPDAPPRVLYYVDTVLGTDPILDALSSVGAELATLQVFSGLNSAIGADPAAWDMIIIMNQIGVRDFSAVTNLANYRDAGGRVIFSDCGTSNWGLFGATDTGNTNETGVDITCADLAVNVTDPMALANPGWSIFSRGLSADTASGYWSAAVYGNADDAVVISPDFRTAAVGFLCDTHADTGDAIDFYVNLFNLLMQKRTTWLLVGNGSVEATDMIEGHLSSEEIAYRLVTPAEAGALSLADLTGRFDVIYVSGGVGGSSPLATAAVQDSLSYGAMSQWAKNGGTMLLNLCHSDGVDYLGPGGSIVHRATGAGDDAPTVADTNHEYITGVFSASPMTLTDAHFLGWSVTCHGQVSPPYGYADTGGRNLGTNPAIDSFNVILDGSTSGSSGVTYALIEYTYGSGYVMMDCMTYDWAARPTDPTVFYQLIDYIHDLAQQ